MAQDFGYDKQAQRKLALVDGTITVGEGLKDALTYYAEAWAAHHNASEAFLRYVHKHGAGQLNEEGQRLADALEDANRAHETAKTMLGEELWDSI